MSSAWVSRFAGVGSLSRLVIHLPWEERDVPGSSHRAWPIGHHGKTNGNDWIRRDERTSRRLGRRRESSDFYADPGEGDELANETDGFARCSKVVRWDESVHECPSLP